MLADAEALAAAGGVAAIRDALIDDCALGAMMKKQGPIWLGLTDRVVSLRPYRGFEDIRSMVARSAYAQLHYSPLLLAGTVVGLALTYLAAPVITLFGSGAARIFAAAAWALMALAYSADPAVLSGIAALGPGACRPSRPSIVVSRSTAPGSLAGQAAACGKGARRRCQKSALKAGLKGNG